MLHEHLQGFLGPRTDSMSFIPLAGEATTSLVLDCKDILCTVDPVKYSMLLTIQKLHVHAFFFVVCGGYYEFQELFLLVCSINVCSTENSVPFSPKMLV